MPKYVIEHLDSKLYKWCFLEYLSISETVGRENLVITNVKNPKDRKKLMDAASEVKEESSKELGLSNACLLDMGAEKELSSSDNFDYLVFGGILGDNPPRERTKKFFAWFDGERRHLGKMQMPTDNAVLVAKMIVHGKKISEIKFIDEPEFDMEDGLSVTLPFRFVDVNGKPFIKKEILEHIKKSGF